MEKNKIINEIANKYNIDFNEFFNLFFKKSINELNIILNDREVLDMEGIKCKYLKQIKEMYIIGDDKRFLKEIYDNLSEEDVKKVKKDSLILMKDFGFNPNVYRLMFDTTYKFISMRRVLKDLLKEKGYALMGDIYFKNQWISYDEYYKIQKEK